MEREAFPYVKAKLLNSSITNRNYFGSGKVYFYLTGTYMNDSRVRLLSSFLASLLKSSYNWTFAKWIEMRRTTPSPAIFCGFAVAGSDPSA